MVFPAEATLRLRRRSLQVCQELMRVVVDTVRETVVQTGAFQKGDLKAVEQAYANITQLKEKAMEAKRGLTNELIEAGAILLSREDFLRLAAPVTEMADLAEGVSYRLKELASRKAKVPKEVSSDLVNLADAVLNSALRLREVIISLSYDSSKVEELAKNVESSERIVDTLYRSTETRIVFFDKIDIPVVIVLRDVANLLEEIADKTEDAADSARILALSAF
jgi:predicted phosphate transport protein (TIGR00153 family)